MAIEVSDLHRCLGLLLEATVAAGIFGETGEAGEKCRPERVSPLQTTWWTGSHSTGQSWRRSYDTC
jgi:hypothetical protein